MDLPTPLSPTTTKGEVPECGEDDEGERNSVSMSAERVELGGMWETRLWAKAKVAKTSGSMSSRE